MPVLDYLDDIKFGAWRPANAGLPEAEQGQVARAPAPAQSGVHSITHWAMEGAAGVMAEGERTASEKLVSNVALTL